MTTSRVLDINSVEAPVRIPNQEGKYVIQALVRCNFTPALGQAFPQRAVLTYTLTPSLANAKYFLDVTFKEEHYLYLPLENEEVRDFWIQLVDKTSNERLDTKHKALARIKELLE